MRYIEELHTLFPPAFIFLLQRCQPLPTVRGVLLHKLQPRLDFWQWRLAEADRSVRLTHIDAQHVAKPQILAHALMYHLLPHTPPARVVRPRTHRHVLIPELAPHADHLHAFSGVRLDKKFVSHNLECYSGLRLRSFSTHSVNNVRNSSCV